MRYDDRHEARSGPIRGPVRPGADEPYGTDEAWDDPWGREADPVPRPAPHQVRARPADDQYRYDVEDDDARAA